MTPCSDPAREYGLDFASAVPDIAPVVFPSRAATTGSRPSVRIFLGTEPAQHRAERVFLYALSQVRDPARRYEVYRMCDLPGFDRRRWRTGFTNYRFAIPDLAGRKGRAIYNDVDQIYTADPAALFDADMASHGYLALSPQDTAVMLLDCAQMANVWTLASARIQDKKRLLEAAATTQWGPLDPAWHARDGEYVRGHSRLLHYTALHTQPWRPMPVQYSYHPHPLGELWLSLERAADAEGYQVFGPTAPSPRFAAACIALDRLSSLDSIPTTSAQALLRRLDCRIIERLGPVPAGAKSNIPASLLCAIDFGSGGGCDALLAAGLEVFSSDDLPWILDVLFRRARHVVYFAVRLGAAHAPANGEDWWQDTLLRLARRYPDRCWHLDLLGAAGQPVRRLQSDFAARETPPRVWLLEGLHGGDNTQLWTLAERLGWPWTTRRLALKRRDRLPAWRLAARPRHFRPQLSPPWPDLVLFIGRRTAAAARWIRRRSGGRSRIVSLGRPQASLTAFDRIVTTPQYGLPLRKNVVCLPGPLVEPSDPTDPAVATWAKHLAHLPRPWIAVLVGGNSRPYRLTPEAARALGEQASQAAAARNGSLLVTTSSRTSRAAADTLFAAIDGPAYCHRFQANSDADDNPYRALLALADALIVTGESASMLTEACATGKPVAVFELPVHRDRLSLRLQHWLESGLGLIERPAGSRGTPKRQHALGRLYDRMVAAGWIRRERRMHEIHRALGVRPLPEGLDSLPALGPRELDQAYAEAVASIRDVLRAPRAVR